MSDGHDPARASRSSLKALVWSLRAGFALALAPAALSLMDARAQPPARTRADRSAARRRELRSYLWGLGLALILTFSAFVLVYWSLLPRFWILLSIGVLAFVQVVAHFRFFLHIDPPRENMEDLHLILFSTLILSVMTIGTIWVLTNLATRMGM